MWIKIPWYVYCLFHPREVVSDLLEEIWVWISIPSWLVIFLLGALAGAGVVWTIM